MTVLVGSLPTREGRAALRAAVDECLARSLDLVVVAAHTTGDVAAEEQSAWDAAADDAQRRLAEAGRGCIITRADGDEVGQALLDTSELDGADLIVIGLRRRTPVGKLLLGSNAQRVLLEATCPVLAVKAADGE